MQEKAENSILRYAIYLIALVSLVYCFFAFPNITYQKPFSDDWMMLEVGRGLHNKSLVEWLSVKDDFNQWRPMPYIFTGIYLKGETCDLALYNTFKLFIFIGIIMLTYFTSTLFLKDRQVAALSALFFLLNPTNIGAVQNIDHVYKLTGTLFYGITIVSLYLYFKQEKQETKYIIICFISYIISFFSDADAVAIFPAICLLTIFNIRNRKMSIRKSAIIIGTSLLILVFYLYLRSIIVGGAFSGGLSGKQDIVLSFNILYNSLKLLISSLIFTVSPYIYFKKPAYIAFGAFFMILNVSVIFFAIFKSSNEQRGKLFLLLCLSLIGMIPFVFIRHVSEIYSFRPSYLLMIILAYSYMFLYGTVDKKLKNIIIISFVLVLIFGAYSLKVKQDMMLKRGLMAEEMANSMMQVVPTPLPFSTINLLVNDCGVKDTYSDFINNDIQLAGIIKFFVRYNYNDKTLNSIDKPQNVYNLEWNCDKKKFYLLSQKVK